MTSNYHLKRNINSYGVSKRKNRKCLYFLVTIGLLLVFTGIGFVTVIIYFVFINITFKNSLLLRKKLQIESLNYIKWLLTILISGLKDIVLINFLDSLKVSETLTEYRIKLQE